jgi:hypothetical protein
VSPDADFSVQLLLQVLISGAPTPNKHLGGGQKKSRAPKSWGQLRWCESLAPINWGSVDHLDPMMFERVSCTVWNTSERTVDKFSSCRVTSDLATETRGHVLFEFLVYFRLCIDNKTGHKCIKQNCKAPIRSKNASLATSEWLYCLPERYLDVTHNQKWDVTIMSTFF